MSWVWWCRVWVGFVGIVGFEFLQNFQLLVFPLWNSELCWNCLMISLNSLISILASDPAKMRLLIPFLGIFFKESIIAGMQHFAH